MTRRLTWEELRAYWEGHAAGDGWSDPARDPDALNNVIWPGQPLWLNSRFARQQAAAYDVVLPAVAAMPGRALDVGCGSGRWCRHLAALGYDVTGIDLQGALLERNRARYPHMTFHQVALQDFDSGRPFDLVSCVTVLQHNPPEVQVDMVRRMRALLRPGGHAVMLENVLDQAPHVFSRDVPGWQELFESEGLRVVRRHRYDYGAAMRTVLQWRDRVVGRRSAGHEATIGALGPVGKGATGARRLVRDLGLGVAVAIDIPLEVWWTRLRAERTSVHCAFLLEAVP